MQTACEKAVSTMHSVLQRTLKHALGKGITKLIEVRYWLCIAPAELSGGETPNPEQIELRLIQSKEDIERSPPISTLFS